MNKPDRFVQIVTSRTSLTALTESGACWVYVGNEYGWAPLNMKRLSVQQARKAWKHKHGEEFVDDDIPFD